MSSQILSHLEQVICGKADRFSIGTDRDRPPRVIFPGSFNPLHVGHREIARIAANLIGSPVYYEIAIDNVDKPSLTARQLLERLDQFDETETVAITGATKFDQKAALFPGTIFAVGIDTLIRIGSTAYYGASGKGDSGDLERRRDQAIGKIEEQGCGLLIFGRKMGEKFNTLSDLSIPPSLEKICQAVPETLFREDISSSDLR